MAQDMCRVHKNTNQHIFQTYFLTSNAGMCTCSNPYLKASLSLCIYTVHICLLTHLLDPGSCSVTLELDVETRLFSNLQPPPVSTFHMCDYRRELPHSANLLLFRDRLAWDSVTERTLSFLHSSFLKHGVIGIHFYS